MDKIHSGGDLCSVFFFKRNVLAISIFKHSTSDLYKPKTTQSKANLSQTNGTVQAVIQKHNTLI